MPHLRLAAVAWVLLTAAYAIAAARGATVGGGGGGGGGSGGGGGGGDGDGDGGVPPARRLHANTCISAADAGGDDDATSVDGLALAAVVSTAMVAALVAAAVSVCRSTAKAQPWNVLPSPSSTAPNVSPSVASRSSSPSSSSGGSSDTPSARAPRLPQLDVSPRHRVSPPAHDFPTSSIVLGVCLAVDVLARSAAFAMPDAVPWGAVGLAQVARWADVFLLAPRSATSFLITLGAVGVLATVASFTCRRHANAAVYALAPVSYLLVGHPWACVSVQPPPSPPGATRLFFTPDCGSPSRCYTPVHVGVLAAALLVYAVVMRTVLRASRTPHVRRVVPLRVLLGWAPVLLQRHSACWALAVPFAANVMLLVSSVAASTRYASLPHLTGTHVMVLGADGLCTAVGGLATALFVRHTTNQSATCVAAFAALTVSLAAVSCAVALVCCGTGALSVRRRRLRGDLDAGSGLTVAHRGGHVPALSSTWPGAVPAHQPPPMAPPKPPKHPPPPDAGGDACAGATRPPEAVARRPRPQATPPAVATVAAVAAAPGGGGGTHVPSPAGCTHTTGSAVSGAGVGLDWSDDHSSPRSPPQRRRPPPRRRPRDDRRRRHHHRSPDRRHHSVARGDDAYTRQDVRYTVRRGYDRGRGDQGRHADRAHDAWEDEYTGRHADRRQGRSRTRRDHSHSHDHDHSHSHDHSHDHSWERGRERRVPVSPTGDDRRGRRHPNATRYPPPARASRPYPTSPSRRLSPPPVQPASTVPHADMSPDEVVQAALAAVAELECGGLLPGGGSPGPRKLARAPTAATTTTASTDARSTSVASDRSKGAVDASRRGGGRGVHARGYDGVGPSLGAVRYLDD